MLLQSLPEVERVEFGDRVLIGRDEITGQPVLRTNGTDATLGFIQRSSYDDEGDGVFDDEDVKRMEEVLGRFLPKK